jgi:hypothetical protein
MDGAAVRRHDPRNDCEAEATLDASEETSAPIAMTSLRHNAR